MSCVLEAMCAAMLDNAGSLSFGSGRDRREYRLTMVCQNAATKGVDQGVAGECGRDVERAASFRVSLRPSILNPSSLIKCVLHSKKSCEVPKWRIRGEKIRSCSAQPC